MVPHVRCARKAFYSCSSNCSIDRLWTCDYCMHAQCTSCALLCSTASVLALAPPHTQFAKNSEVNARVHMLSSMVAALLTAKSVHALAHLVQTLLFCWYWYQVADKHATGTYRPLNEAAPNSVPASAFANVCPPELEHIYVLVSSFGLAPSHSSPAAASISLRL